MGNRASLDGLALEILRRSEKVRAAAPAIVAAFATQGEKDMEAVIKAAETETGQRRAETGGRSSQYGSVSPGRIDSGQMINAVSSEHDGDGSSFRGAFGWTKEVEDYYLIQENGDGRIAAMHALQSSFVANREIALRAIHDLI